MALVIVLLLALIGVIADTFLKLASQKESGYFSSIWFFLGMAIFAASSFGWVLAMKKIKLAELGAIYGVGTVLFLVVIGLLFGERLALREVLGIVLAVASIILLAKFS